MARAPAVQQTLAAQHPGQLASDAAELVVPVPMWAHALQQTLFA